MVGKYLACSRRDTISEELRLSIDSYHNIAWLTTSKTAIIGLLHNSLRLLLSISDSTVIFNNRCLSKTNESRIHLSSAMNLGLRRWLSACVDGVGARLAIARIYG